MTELELSQEDLYSPTTITHTTIGHKGFLENTISAEFNPENTIFLSEVGSTKISPDQSGFFKTNTFEPGIIESGLRQVSGSKYHAFNSRIAQVSSTQISTEKVSFYQTGSTQIGSTQIGSVKIRLPELTSPENSITQIRPNEIALPQINIGQVSSTQNYPSHVNPDSHDVAVTQNDTAQIQTSELSWLPGDDFWERSLNNDFTKISFPSSITADEVSNKNFLLRHIISPTSFNTYNSRPCFQTPTALRLKPGATPTKPLKG